LLPLEAAFMHRKDEKLERYSRQIRFAPIGATGQQKLSEANILIVGSGALGASLAQHMARAGVGSIRLVDRDYVEWSNLQRQMLFDEEDARCAWPKAVAAAAKLRRINSSVRMEALVADINKHNVESLLIGIDLVLDGTDNLETRLLLSDACYMHGIPLLYGGVAGSDGMSAMLIPGENCCLRCLLGEEQHDLEGAAPTCDTIGVIAPAVELVSALQAAEALKWLTGNREVLRRTWVVADMWDFSLKEWALPPVQEDCPICGWGELESSGDESDRLDLGGKDTTSLITLEPTDPIQAKNEESAAVSLCGRDTIQVNLNRHFCLTERVAWLEARGCEITANNVYLLRAVIPSGERLVLFSDGRVLIQGAEETDRALDICRLYLLQALDESEEGRAFIVDKAGF
jgi:molybdopterin/thiamine biosynthesis adenylyltransferase